MDQQPQSVPSYPVELGDELGLIALWKIVLQKKLFIFIVAIAVSLLSIYSVKSGPEVYETTLLVVPASGTSVQGSSQLGKLTSSFGISLGQKGGNSVSERSLVILKTYSFLVKFIKDNDLKPILFPDKWDSEKKKMD
jgi:hypothetical protein